MEMAKIANSEEVIYIPSGNISDNQQELIRDDEHKRRETLFLHLSAFTACMVLFAGTTDMVWTSPVIPKLKSNDSDINPLGQPITAYQISLIAGLPALTLVVGGLAFAKLPNLIGRKRAIMCMAAGMLASNIAVACGGHVYVYYVGRSAFSLFRGAASIAVPIYLSEICEDCNRVKFGCLMGLANPAGNLFGYLVGPVTSVRVFTLLCVAPLVPSLLFFSTVVPESPVYLASVKDRVGSIRALGKLRRYEKPEEIERDYKRIEEALEARAGVKTSGFLSWFKTRAVRRGLLIGVGLKLAQNFAGVVVIMSFLGPMFNDAGTRLSGNSVAILVGIVKIITFLVTSFTVEKVGRRPLLLFSCIGSGIPLFFLGLYFYWKNSNQMFIEDIRWLPIVCILGYIINFSLGLGPIPIALVSQLFPSDIISVAISFTMTIMAIVVFLLTSAYPIVSEILGVHYFIWLFSMCCFVSSGFIYFMVPETKGKSILEIQKLLEKK